MTISSCRDRCLFRSFRIFGNSLSFLGLNSGKVCSMFVSHFHNRNALPPWLLSMRKYFRDKQPAFTRKVAKGKTRPRAIFVWLISITYLIFSFCCLRSELHAYKLSIFVFLETCILSISSRRWRSWKYSLESKSIFFAYFLSCGSLFILKIQNFDFFFSSWLDQSDYPRWKDAVKVQGVDDKGSWDWLDMTNIKVTNVTNVA